MSKKYNKKLQEKIIKLKQEKNVIIYAHNYQRKEVQEIADVIGDSLYLAQQIKNNPPKSKIIYCSVKFMAETASILNPSAKIYLPVSESLCPMAAFGKVQLLRRYKQRNPNVPIVLYINSTAEAKKYADVICTSSNALEICQKIQKEFKSKKIGFSPDKNLGSYVQSQMKIPFDFIPKDGHCFVHNDFKVQDIQEFKKEHPNAKILVHPECTKNVVNEADFVGSTAAMYNYMVSDPDKEYGIGTEKGLVDRINLDYPDIKAYPLRDNAVCYSMKKFTLESILDCLDDLEKPEFSIEIDEVTRKEALKPIQKMFDLMG